MDANLEALIDEAGRDAVFARARALGWSVYHSPPKWVWHGIVHEVRKAKESAPQYQYLDRLLLQGMIDKHGRG